MGKRAAAADIGRGAAHTVQGNPWPYVVPPAGAVANLILSGVLSLLWGAKAADVTVWDTAWRSALIVVASLAIILVTWAAGRARQGVLRAVSMGMSVCSCAGLFVLTFKGWSFDRVMVYAIVMSTACLCLAVIRLLRGDGGDERPHPFGKVAERVAELRSVGELGRSKTIDGAVVTPVKMLAGTEFTDLQKAQGAIATLVPTAKNNVRLIPDPERPGEGIMEITAHDYIEHPPPWPGLSCPGGCISDMVRLAVYGNGRPLPLYLFGDETVHRNAIGLLVIAGQPGAGKTELVLELGAEVVTRRNADLSVIDARKGEQLPDWLKRSARVITDMATAERFIAGLVDRVAERAGVLGREGLKQWSPKSQLRAEVVIIDEAAKLVASRNEEEMVELAESVRSVGILLVLVQQRVTIDRLPSSVKKARGGSICMGVTDDAEAGRVLSEQTLAAGASPGALGNRKPGCLYAELPGIPEQDWSRMARTYQPPKPEVLAAAVEAHLGPLPAAPTSSPAAADRPAGDEPDSADDRAVPDPDRLDMADDDPQCRPESDDPEVPLSEAGDPREPLTMPARPRIRFGSDAGDRQWTKTDLLAVIRQALLDAYAQGKTRIKKAELGPVVEFVGPDNLKPPRLSGYLAELCQPGPQRLLRRDRDSGWYIIEPPEAAGDRELVGAGGRT